MRDPYLFGPEQMSTGPLVFNGATALFVFFPASARTGIVAADFGFATAVGMVVTTVVVVAVSSVNVRSFLSGGLAHAFPFAARGGDSSRQGCLQILRQLAAILGHGLNVTNTQSDHRIGVAMIGVITQEIDRSQRQASLEGKIVVKGNGTSNVGLDIRTLKVNP